MLLMKYRFLLLILLNLAFTSVSSAIAQDTVENPVVTAQAYRNVNVRSGPGTGYDIIDQLEEGRIVNVTGRSDADSNWLFVEFDETRGWVAYFTVSLEGDAAALPILSIESSAQSVTTIQTVPSASLIPENSLALPNAEPSESSGEIYVSAYRRVNVRSGPGTEFNILGVLVPGERANVVGSSGAGNEWLQISFEGQTGWVAYFVVNVTGDLTSLASTSTLENVPLDSVIAESLASPLLPVTDQVVIITRFNTNLRVQPTYSADIITVIPYQTTLQPEARTANSQWLQVTYEGQTGWLIASLVNTGVSDLTALPVVEIPTP